VEAALEPVAESVKGEPATRLSQAG
jgi:hypothetical protein